MSVGKSEEISQEQAEYLKSVAPGWHIVQDWHIVNVYGDTLYYERTLEKDE